MKRQLIPFVAMIAVIVFVVPRHTVIGQPNSLQSFTTAAGSFYSNQSDALEIDWRLDLGLTAIEMNQAPPYLFTAGFIQPVIHRFTNKNEYENYDPKIQLRYSDGGRHVLLLSTETDLVIYGFQIIDLSGRLVFQNQSRFASSYLRIPIDLTTLTRGLYLVSIFYLPESIFPIDNKQYWIKNIKLLKQ